MQPEIINQPEMVITGMWKTMSFAHDQTPALWQTFAPRIKEIANRKNKDRISLKIFPYSPGLVQLTPVTLFQKWAAVPVTDFSHVPDGMETRTIPAGLYAVFLHKGTSETFGQTLQYIFTRWLPSSDYDLDNRPHYEIMGEHYRLNDPASEEKIFIPVKRKITGQQ